MDVLVWLGFGRFNYRIDTLQKEMEEKLGKFEVESG